MTGGYIVLFKQDALVDLKSLSTKINFICTHEHINISVSGSNSVFSFSWGRWDCLKPKIVSIEASKFVAH